jgi:hypothetical protein
MKKISLIVCLFCFYFQHTSHAQKLRVLTNHLGYETTGPKHAVIQGKESDQVTSFKIKEFNNDQEVLSGTAIKTGPVKKWKDWHFWTIDFDDVS